MQGQSVKMGGFGKPKTVPSPGAVSKLAPTGAAPKPKPLKNTRDYGKAPPAGPLAPSPQPSPFGLTDGGSRLGGI